MKVSTVSATELKNRLGAYLERVRRGQTVLVTDRGRTIGRIIPEAPDRADGLVQRLAARGLIRDLPRKRSRGLPRRVRVGGRDASDLIVAERDLGR